MEDALSCQCPLCIAPIPTDILSRVLDASNAVGHTMSLADFRLWLAELDRNDGNP